jgi:GntP family gluconate:H+ symporter
MIAVGSLIGFGAALCGYVFARFICRRITLVPEDDDAPPADTPERVLPPLWLSLIPVLLPLLLIGLQGVLAPSMKGVSAWWVTLVKTIGATDMALTFGVLSGLLLVVRQRPPGGTQKAVQAALAHGALILLITAGGGAFGGALQQTGIAEAIGQMVGGAHTLALPAVFLVTALVRTAQGSATVAMITAVPIAKAFLDSGHTGVAAVYFAVVIGCGSKPVSWMNDAGFWAVVRMSGMTESQGLRTMTPMMSLQGVAGLVLTMLAAWLFPLR